MSISIHHLPTDLKNLSSNELDALCRDLRRVIIDTVSTNGGHLASNLGVVELSVALHRVFSSPQDLLVWVVGHQCYAHKLLTGRAEKFSTLRKIDGISGFPKREESVHDAFNTGHSSTSISAALGIAEASRLNGHTRHVIAIVGDGALTGGMIWEAMNHAVDLGRPLIVVLNDNEMSISYNLGSITRYLNKFRTAPAYRKTKRSVIELLKKTPVIGEWLAKWISKFKSGLKQLLLPGIIFEDLGFTYLGPLDAHNVSDLCAVLQQAKQLDTPVVVHCISKKGKGYVPAEINPSAYHGVGNFDVDSGNIDNSRQCLSFTDVFGATLVTLADSDSKIVAISAAMVDGTGLKQMAQKHSSRLYDVGIAEQHAVTFAAGLASQGLMPVVALYSTFVQRAYDQLLHDVCLQ
ncbi:MAG: 1-deoxy-D-xylulose-5-phosphate synthase, partial [bacterium]|nr:1-deoxy-D-xylulose-5-phosphate synthase [bacterium]